MRSATLETPPAATPPAPERRRTGRVLTAAGVFIAGCAVVGWYLQEVAGIRLYTSLPPLTADLDPRISLRLAVAVTLGGAVAWWGPAIAQRLTWRGLLWASFAAAAAWGAALAFADGTPGFLRSPGLDQDYLASLPFVTDPGAFLHGFVDALPSYSTHVRSHPPGMLLLLWAADRVGAGGPGWFAAMQMLGAAAAVPAALLVVRRLAHEPAARVIAPFLVLAPAAVWWSSGDAVFLGAGAWAVALTVLAVASDGRRSRALALAGGALFAVTIFLSYGLVLLGLIPLALAWRRRAWRVLAVAAVPVVALVVLAAAAGFRWWDGLVASKHQYDIFVTNTRPYAYFVFANLAAFAFALGPAIVALLGRPRDRDVWPIVGAALAAVLLADVSGLSAGEVERIWLPFLPWVAIAAVAYARDPVGRRRGWLFAQAGTAVALQALVRSPW